MSLPDLSLAVLTIMKSENEMRDCYYLLLMVRRHAFIAITLTMKDYSVYRSVAAWAISHAAS